MKQKKYWKGLEELNQTPEFKEGSKNEFPEQLPVLDAVKDITNAPSKRRDFLKMLGFSIGAATLAASCETPIRKAIPYVNKPEEIIPGIANYYASTFVDGSDVCSILVKTREGRPINIQGNKESGLTKGGVSARAIASVVGLYDGARLRGPKVRGEKTTWEETDKAIKAGLASASGDIVLLTSSISSPSTKRLLSDFAVAYPNFKAVTYEPISNAGMLLANEQSFGRKMIPGYDFAKAEVIVGINCDFTGTWISPVEFSYDYAKNRKVDPDHPKMSRHYQFEPKLTQAGSNADYRYTTGANAEGQIAAALYNAVAQKTGGTAVSANLNGLSDAVKKGIDKAAADLARARGKSLIVSGSNDTNVQVLVNGINAMLDNYGQTIDLTTEYNVCQGDDQAMDQLVKDMAAGRVGAVMLNGVNPAYDYYNAKAYVDAVKKVKLRVSFNDRADESSDNMEYFCPTNHYLESWNDAEPKSGFYSIGQPTIAPLFDTRSMQDSLMSWADIEGDYYTYLRNNWKESLFSRQSAAGSFEDFWNQSVHNGVFEPAGGTVIDELPGPNQTFAGNVAAAAGKIGITPSGLSVVLYEKSAMGNGKYANNPFLQETPDPLSKVCWDNYAVVSKTMADEQRWKDNDIVKLSAGGSSFELPVVVMPGQLKDTVALALGYGRTKPGNEKCTVGKNAYPWVSFNGETLAYSVGGASIEKVGSNYPLAHTQTHGTIDDEREIIREFTMPAYMAEQAAKHGAHDKHAKGAAGGGHGHDHDHGHDGHGHEGEDGHDAHGGGHPLVTLYPSRAEELGRGHHWGMNIDLNACIGCGACVVACNIENNVPVVGSEEVYRAHEMHWLRIDRYYGHDVENDPHAENPTVAFQPMLCQHCDNAPCENVCPVNATNHSTEGLNQMAYNRCIGTRYCANNCPYKVRRFNWFDYQGADSFYKDTIFDNDEYVMADDLTRMVLNPDVTVRSRGVMEKCSFCVQRIQEGKLEAKKAGKKLEDGAIQTACQAACTAGAIIFGDMNDKESAVSKANENDRSYHLIEEYHFLPSISYMAKVRNVEEEA